MSPKETFVIRLRRHRQRNRVSLQAIAKETNVKVEMLEALERNDLSEWPRGVYARAWVRAYASAIGLDPIRCAEPREFHPQIDQEIAAVAPVGKLLELFEQLFH